MKINLLHENQEQERKALLQDLSHIHTLDQTKSTQSFEKEWSHDLARDQRSQFEQEFDTDLDMDMDDSDIDMDPEI